MFHGCLSKICDNLNSATLSVSQKSDLQTCKKTSNSDYTGYCGLGCKRKGMQVKFQYSIYAY